MGPCAILLVCIVNTLTGIIRARIALFVIIHFHIFFRMLRKMHGKKYDRKLLCLRFISQVKVAVLTFFLENNDIKCISLFELKLWRMHQKFKRDIIVQKFMTKNIIQKILQQENNTLHEKWSFPVRICSVNMKLRIWSHLLKKSVMKNFIFCVVAGTPSSSTPNFRKHMKLFQPISAQSSISYRKQSFILQSKTNN